MKSTSLLKAIGLALVTVYCSTSSAEAVNTDSSAKSINAYNPSTTTTLYYLERRGMGHIRPGKSKALKPPLNFYCTDSKVGAVTAWRKRQDVQCLCHPNHLRAAPKCEVKTDSGSTE